MLACSRWSHGGEWRERIASEKKTAKRLGSSSPFFSPTILLRHSLILNTLLKPSEPPSLFFARYFFGQTEFLEQAYKMLLSKKSFLQSGASNHDHPPKFMISFWQLYDIFLTTFWWVPFKKDSWSARTGKGEVKCHVDFLQLHSDWPDGKRSH